MAPKRGRFDRRSTAGASTPLSPPPDVVFEILSWLSGRFLARCRCVCTSWRALISDPAFLAAQRSRAEPLLVAATDSVGGTMATTSLQIMDTDGCVVRLVDLGGLWTFRASLGDLVLITSCSGNDSEATISVIDLASGGTILSCPGPAAEAADLVTTWFGFGRAARSGALKVVRIVCRSFWFGEDHLTCEVLTLVGGGSGGWRPTGSPPSKFHGSYVFRDGVAVNGVLHFLSTWLDGIFCFNLESEEWTMIRGPPGAVTRKEEISSGELNGDLCVAHVKGHTVNIWLLDINKDVWVNEFTILLDLPPSPRDRVVELVPLRVTRPGGKLLFYYRADYGSAAVLQVYDPGSGKCTEVEKKPTEITGRIGLCSSHLIGSRLCSQS